MMVSFWKWTDKFYSDKINWINKYIFKCLKSLKIKVTIVDGSNELNRGFFSWETEYIQVSYKDKCNILS